MPDVRNGMSMDERDEYDALVYDATHRADGTRWPASQRGPRMLALLRDAEQAQKAWATRVMDNALLDGLSTVAKKWCSTKEIIETKVGERIVKKAAAYGIRQRNAESGKTEWITPLWEDMGQDELIQVIDASRKRTLAEDELTATARRLLRLVEQTGEVNVGDALKAKHVSLEQYLQGDENVA